MDTITKGFYFYSYSSACMHTQSRGFYFCSNQGKMNQDDAIVHVAGLEPKLMMQHDARLIRTVFRGPNSIL